MRLALDLHQREAFATQSKPVQTHDLDIYIVVQDFKKRHMKKKLGVRS